MLCTGLLHHLCTFLFFLFFVTLPISFFLFFFNDTAPTEIYTLSLHDALPILGGPRPDARPAGDEQAGVHHPQRLFVVAMLGEHRDRKSTRLNSSHDQISYAVFCLKKKKKKKKKKK